MKKIERKEKYYEGYESFVVSLDCEITEYDFNCIHPFIPVLMNEGEKDIFGASCGCAFFTAVAMRRADGSDYTLLRPATEEEKRDLLGVDDEDEEW
ncbi:hypothetical protein JK185_14955 [Gluconobacter wancherniae]|uniref:hypothetical protein n=1 Tax=Gluconobacter wancherniae TaxID=1307955 RepID=UPI001B8CA8B8|nr:hypothetical protein [Gluconobacter wancherniae]MBS1064283.1 hypothetical protein [Gluconobacter wancherniae]